jgi:hypothetical protein
MKTRYFAFLFAVFATPSFAAGHITLQDLADEAGMTPRQVGMVLGARSAYPEYLASYSFAKSKFVRAVGAQRYNELVKLYREQKITGQLVARSDAGKGAGS